MVSVMARSQLRTLRVDDEKWASWEAEAQRRGGLSMSAFIKDCVDAEVASTATPIAPAESGGKRSYEPDFKKERG
jgi:hypothetical protein